MDKLKEQIDILLETGINCKLGSEVEGRIAIYLPDGGIETLAELFGRPIYKTMEKVGSPFYLDFDKPPTIFFTYGHFSFRETAEMYEKEGYDVDKLEGKFLR